MRRKPISPAQICDGLSRREALRVGGLGALGLSLPQLLAARQAAGAEGARAKSCIILFLMGGPPQHSTFDPKPEAPAEVRGDFGPISTSVPGTQFGELWPKTALLADRLAVLRAVSTADNAHSSSGYYMLTGQPHAPTNVENANPGFPNDYPNIGSVVRKLRPVTGNLPAAIRLPHRIFNTDGSVWPGQDGGFLGRTAEPWLLNCKPADANFRVDEFAPHDDVTDKRLADRRALLTQFDGHLAGKSRAGLTSNYANLTEQAFGILNSNGSRQAFQLDLESDRVRDRYGRSHFGQGVLLGRRLIEAGVSLVQVNWYRGPDEPPSNPCWDSHTNESARLKNDLCPPADQALSALIEDLQDRGLFDETLVVCMAEFGRTPRMNGAGGRDHWGQVFSVALAGGGIRGGVVHGASDAQGGYPKDNKVSPQDLTATIFHCLGLPPESEMHDTFGRPLPISRGEPIRAIL